MALIVRRTDTAAETHQTLHVVELSLPSPFKHYILFRGTVSWGERVLIALQQRFPRELFSFTGTNLFHDHKIRAFIQTTNRSAAETMEMSNGESLEDPDVQEVMRLSLQKIIDKRLQHLSPFGVNSEAELREKQWRLAEIKNQAVRQYFDTVEGRSKRLAIDQALVRRCSGKLSTGNAEILDQYWSSNREHPWGPEHHLQIEQEIYEQFRKAVSEILGYIEFRKNPYFNMNFGAHLKKELVNETRKIRQKLLEKASKTKDPKQMIFLNYQILKVELLMPPLIRYVLREVLGPIIEKTSKEVEKLAEQKLKEAQKEIAECEEDLRSFKCCIDPEKIQNSFTTPSTPELVASILAVNQQDRELTSNILARLRAKTVDIFLFEARSEWGYSVKEMQAILHEEVDYHRRVIRAFMLVWDLRESPLKSAAANQLDPDLKLNFESMEDPVGYFVQGYQQRDLEALALLQPKIEEVKS